MVVTDWYGILWLLFSTLIIYEILRLFIKINPVTAGFAIIEIVAVITIYSMINTQFLHVRKVTIPGSVNCDIVQVSDIHIGSVSKWFFKRIINQINAQNPDLVLIMGDLVDNINENTRDALQELKKIKVPVVFTTGNHERYAGIEKTQQVLEGLNVKVLRDNYVDMNEIRIIGVDDGTEDSKIKNIAQCYNDNTKYNILMYHRPLDLGLLSQTGANLTLSGHTHKGQIFPFYFVVRHFFPNIYGVYKYQGGILNVNSGCGTWGPRMRFGSRSEITVIQIRRDAK
jgi:predicted MPP superfamily phosphohydrolase